MINGLYSGASALQTLANQQEMISNNLMHANTSGHRRSLLGVKQRFEEQNPEALIDLGPEVDNVTVDFQEGRKVQTGRPLDVSIGGDGFFVFEDASGELLSRNGRLFRDAESNLLVNEEGFPIQGESGPITIGTEIAERDISIATDGTIAAGGQTLGRLKTIAFEDNNTLTKLNAATFRRGNESVESDNPVHIAQFQHELSNVQPVSELVALIVNNRQYEAVQKATRTLSESLQEYIRS